MHILMAALSRSSSVPAETRPHTERAPDLYRATMCHRALPATLPAMEIELATLPVIEMEIYKKRRGEEVSEMKTMDETETSRKKSRVRIEEEEEEDNCCTLLTTAEEVVTWRGRDLFDELPDEILLSILGRLSASAGSSADLISVLLTCKRLNRFGMHPLVLAQASMKVITIEAKNWSESAHQFLRKCAEAGNLDALYTLGMILFYCFRKRGSGVALLAQAAMSSHAAAMYSLAVIQFNGSGGSKRDKNLRAGVALCARAACLGSIDALREFGHCLQDGYGVRRNVALGRRFLFQANAREVAAAVNSSTLSVVKRHHDHHGSLLSSSCSLLSDYGCNVPAPEVHHANRFMVEWFAAASGGGEEGPRLCSHSGCGRPETRPHEFRQCSVCGVVSYCSRACQALHWKLAHKAACVPMERWLDAAEAPPDAVMN